MYYEDTLKTITLADEKFIVMTAENRALIRNLPDQLGDRFIDTGITEQTLVGMAAGLALQGRVPVAHALACFLTMRAFEFIRTDVGIANLPVKLVGFVPGFLSEANGPTHQAIEDVALMRGIPNVGVYCPASDLDLQAGLEKILKSDQPFYIRFNDCPSEYKHDQNFEIGKAEVISEGSDITFLTYGFLFNETLKAKKILEEKGKSVGLVNLRTLKPIDVDVIKKVAENSEKIVTVEDHFVTGGLFSIVSEILTLNGISAQVTPIALENKWFKPTLIKELLQTEGFQGDQIAERVLAG